MSLINHDAIPMDLHEDLRFICADIGPQLLGDRFPGTPGEELTQAQCDESVDLITREFWRQQLAGYRANKAAEEARQAAAAQTAEDPFV